jgi:hypothetical protein
VTELPKPQSISINLNKSPHALLSIIVTSYTTERLGDIFELLDSIKAQTVISQKVGVSSPQPSQPTQQTIII